MGRVSWRWYLLGGLLIIGGSWVLPRLTGLPSVPTRVAGYQLLSLAAVVAILVGVHRHRPDQARAWYVLAGARAVYVVGDLTFYANALVFHDPRFPSLADVFYLGQYPLFMVGLLLLVRRRNPGRDRASLLDALIITIGLGLLSWVFLLDPYVHAAGLSRFVKAVSVAYPLSDLLVLAVAVRLTVGAGTRPPAFYLLAGGLLSLLATDTGYALATLHGTYQSGGPLDTGWMLACLLLGAAALHPSMRTLSAPAQLGGAARLSRGRLVALGGAALMAPGALVLQAVEGQPIDVPVIAGGSVLLFMLVLVRMASLAGEMAAQAERSRLLDRLGAVVDASPVAIVELDLEGRVRLWNPAAERIYGWQRQEVLGQPHPARTQGGWPPVHDAAAQRPTGEPGARLQLRQHHKDGTPIDVELSTAPLHTPVGEPAGMIAVAADISDRKRLEAELRHQAFHDALTGLPNRALFHDRLEHALARISRHGGLLGVLLLDLDGFKSVNDSLGHAAGDELLGIVAKRLRATVRPSDTVARLGGDEFVVLVEDASSPEEADAVAERLLATLAEPLILPGRDTPISVAASIGIVTSAANVPAGELLRDADIAMYLAKGHGGGFRRFEPIMRAATIQRIELEADLRRAVDRGEFTLHYQPIVELDSGRLTGVEALVRWQHPTRGLLAPGSFIPLAEESGLLLPIGRWVLRQACQQVRGWQLTVPGYQHLEVSVNLSAVELAHPNLVADVADALSEAGLEARHLTLELTESLLLDDADATVAKLNALKTLGVRLAIDDFGTGYSSLAYLRRLPVDTLKIDKVFVDAVANDTEASALAQAIIKLAATLHLTPVAEGIEDADQLQRLRELHCHYGQGYHLAKPLDERQLTTLLHQPKAVGHTLAGNKAVEPSPIR